MHFCKRDANFPYPLQRHILKFSEVLWLKSGTDTPIPILAASSRNRFGRIVFVWRVTSSKHWKGRLENQTRNLRSIWLSRIAGWQAFDAGDGWIPAAPSTLNKKWWATDEKWRAQTQTLQQDSGASSSRDEYGPTPSHKGANLNKQSLRWSVSDPSERGMLGGRPRCPQLVT